MLLDRPTRSPVPTVYRPRVVAPAIPARSVPTNRASLMRDPRTAATMAVQSQTVKRRDEFGHHPRDDPHEQCISQHQNRQWIPKRQPTDCALPRRLGRRSTVLPKPSRAFPNVFPPRSPRGKPWGRLTQAAKRLREAFATAHPLSQQTGQLRSRRGRSPESAMRPRSSGTPARVNAAISSLRAINSSSVTGRRPARSSFCSGMAVPSSTMVLRHL